MENTEPVMNPVFSIYTKYFSELITESRLHLHKIRDTALSKYF